jgi:hypothetical protein
MNRLLILLLLVVYSCAPKLATKKTTEDYSEDVSAFRPKIEPVVTETVDEENPNTRRGEYVAPTNDINDEMNVLMDSIIVHNRDKLYLSFTIQVYIGRSREEANQVRENVYRILPDEKPELIYRQPSYKVTVGKYIDRVEAYRTLTALKKKFPGAMLVPQRATM